MSRAAKLVRDAVPDDAAALVRLWDAVGPTARPVERSGGAVRSSRPLSESRNALAALAADPDERLLVVELDGEVVAAMHLRRGPVSPVHTEMAVHTSYLLVLPEVRKHGCAHLLLEAAVTWAEEKDVPHITAITDSGNRDTNRFLARLGLAEVATIRACSPDLLRHKLNRELLGPGAQRRNLGRVLAQRRSMRRTPGA